MATAAGAATGLRHGVVWYTEASDAVVQLAADRYTMGVTGKSFPANKLAMKALNPAFEWFVYNSGTDCYVPPFSDGEHELLFSRAAARGWDGEDVYLHYFDDTRVVLQGDTLFLPGWGGGSAVDPADARIPVYNKNLSRRLANFSTPNSAQLYREVLVEIAFGTPFQGSTVYPDGIFLDNAAFRLFNQGDIVSGGHVAEAPGHPLVTSFQFQDWHWNQNLGPFLTSLKDTLETASAWSADGKRKRLMINVADIWDDSYVSRDAADVLFMEFLYNPVRNYGVNLVSEAYRRDSLAAGAGIACFYAATMTRSLGGSSLTYAETLAGNLAWYLISRTPGTVFFEFANATPNVAGWDTLTWRGVLDAADAEFGAASGDPFVLAQGTDPLGNPYTVTARNYGGGMAVIRNRGNFSEGIEPETAVAVSLPRPLAPVAPSGEAGDAVESITLRNGQAAILLEPKVPAVLLAFTAAWENGGAVVRWETAASPGDRAAFRLYRERADGERAPVDAGIEVSRARSVVSDAGAPAAGARYWLAELTRSGTAVWHGPAVLPPSPGTGHAPLFLAQNRPNPCRGATAIVFTTAEGAPARVAVFDVAGREVVRLFDGPAGPGANTVTWDGRSAAGTPVRPGMYFYRLETAAGTRTRKLILLP
jgi:hypothetical protein